LARKRGINKGRRVRRPEQGIHAARQQSAAAHVGMEQMSWGVQGKEAKVCKGDAGDGTAKHLENRGTVTANKRLSQKIKKKSVRKGTGQKIRQTTGGKRPTAQAWAPGDKKTSTQGKA